MNKEKLLKRLAEKGFKDPVLKAFSEVERENFLLPEYKKYAYEDAALPIGREQTISQPTTIAFMLTLLEPQDGQKILEVGSGSGYVLALLGALNKNSQIYGAEIIKEFAQKADSRLKSIKNVEVYHTPDSLGLKEKAPFDRILVSASTPQVPQALIEQLTEGGIMVCPIEKSIVKIKKINGQIKIEEYPGFVFVPLTELKN